MLPEPIVSRLLLIKDAITEARAIVSGNSPSDYDLIKAVWLADLSIELGLSVIVSHCGLEVGAKKDVYHKDLMDAVFTSDRPELKNLLQYRAGLLRLHKSRNLVQHHGQSFSLSSSQGTVLDAEHFLQEVFDTVFHSNLDSFSRISFVRFEEARRYLEEAEKELQQGNYDEAAYKASIAFETGKNEFRDKLRKLRETQNHRWYKPWSERIVEKMTRGFGEGREIRDGLEELTAPFELARVGVDFNKAIEFFERRPEAANILMSDKWFRLGDRVVEKPEEARAILAFVADALYRLHAYLVKL